MSIFDKIVGFKINSNSLVPLATSILRHAITAGAASAGVDGVITGDVSQAVASSLVVVASAAYSGVKAYRNNKQKLIMEPYVPDSIASVK